MLNGLERGTFEVFERFALVGAREQHLKGDLVCATGVVGEFADSGIVRVSHLEPFILHAEHHDEGVHVVVGDRLGDGHAVGIDTRETFTLVGQTVTEPHTDCKRIEVEVETFAEVVEILLMLVDEVRTDGDIAERSFLFALAFKVKITADVSRPFHGTVVVSFKTVRDEALGPEDGDDVVGCHAEIEVRGVTQETGGHVEGVDGQLVGLDFSGLVDDTVFGVDHVAEGESILVEPAVFVGRLQSEAQVEILGHFQFERVHQAGCVSVDDTAFTGAVTHQQDTDTA